MHKFNSRAGTALLSVLILAGALAFGSLRAGTGASAQAAGPASEHTSFLDNGKIRVGVNLDLGGAITWVSRSGASANLINSFDWGRQIQMSHYAFPVPFTPNGKQPEKSWAGLGWNPIQSGDCFGNRSRIVAHTNDGKSIYVKCIPMQWPLNNEPGECTFECWITLDGAAAQVHSRLNNARSDKTQYPARDQELPALYTNGPWYRLMTYAGDRPFTGDTLKQVPAAFPWSGWQATENWAALVNDQDEGVGIWEPGAYSFIGGFAGKPGAGGPKDSPTGYIAPLQVEILDSNIQYDYRYVLIVGRTREIRDFVYAHAHPQPRPSWRFETDRQHWRYVNASDTGWPIKGELNVNLEKNDPQLISPTTLWRAADAPILKIEAAFHTGEQNAEVFWKRREDNGFKEECSARFPVIPDGVSRTYTVNLAKSPTYRGLVTALRLDPASGGHPGDTMRIRSIALSDAPTNRSRPSNSKAALR